MEGRLGCQRLGDRKQITGRGGHLYAPGTGGADPTYGHVGVVKEVKEDRSYIEEGYNGEPAPG
jgi:hypothetical protein